MRISSLLHSTFAYFKSIPLKFVFATFVLHSGFFIFCIYILIWLISSCPKRRGSGEIQMETSLSCHVERKSFATIWFLFTFPLLLSIFGPLFWPFREFSFVVVISCFVFFLVIFVIHLLCVFHVFVVCTLACQRTDAAVQSPAATA